MLQKDLISAREPGSRALLIALHGLGDSMEGYRFLPGLLNLPALNYLLVNAPDAYYGGFSWYDFAADAGPGVERSYKLLADLLDKLPEEGFSHGQIVLFGFSQGSLMTIETGLRYPRKLAGCVGISGYAHEPERLLKQLSPVAREQQFLLTHGTRDALIPLNLVRPQVELLRAAGLQIEFREYEKDHLIIEPEIERVRSFIQERLFS